MKIMHTMASQKIAAMPKRRFYEPQLKRQIVAESQAPGASVAGAALAHGINANASDDCQRDGHDLAFYIKLTGSEWCFSQPANGD